MSKRLFRQATFKPMVQVHIELDQLPDEHYTISKIWDFCIHNHIYSKGATSSGGGKLIKYLLPEDAEKLKNFIEKLKKEFRNETSKKS